MAISSDSTLDQVSDAAPGAAVTNGTSSAPKLFKYSDHALGKARPLRIIIIGAGIAGIAGVKLFKERFKDLPTTLTIYEKNADVGGTWLENRYPGYSTFSTAALHFFATR